MKPPTGAGFRNHHLGLGLDLEIFRVTGEISYGGRMSCELSIILLLNVAYIPIHTILFSPTLAYNSHSR